MKRNRVINIVTDVGFFHCSGNFVAFRYTNNILVINRIIFRQNSRSNYFRKTFESFVIEFSVFSSSSELKRPTPVGVRAELTKSFEDETGFIINYSSDCQNFKIVSPVPVSSIHGKDVYAEKISDKLWNVTLGKYIKDNSLEANVLSAKISESGVIHCLIVNSEKVESVVRVVYDYGGKASAIASVNKKIIIPESIKGESWRMATVPCLPGTNDIFVGVVGVDTDISNVNIRVFIKNNGKLNSTRILICHGKVQTCDNTEKPVPILQNSYQNAKQIVSKKVTLSSDSGLIRGKRALIESQFGMIKSAWLKVDIFDVNGGKYSNKTLYLNNEKIGKLPENPPPLSSWKSCEIKIPWEIIKFIKFNNVITLKDNTGDAYKIRNLCLEVELIDGIRACIKHMCRKTVPQHMRSY